MICFALRVFSRGGSGDGRGSRGDEEHRADGAALRRCTCAQSWCVCAEDGRLIFDINDFDETFRGPFEWDLKRMAASLVLAGRESGNKENLCTRAVEGCIRSYTERIGMYAPMPVLDVVRDQIIRFEEVAPVHQALRKAVRATPLHTMLQLTEPVPGFVCWRGTGWRSRGESGEWRCAPAIQGNQTYSHACDRGEGRFGFGFAEGVQADAAVAAAAFSGSISSIGCGLQGRGTGSVGLRDYCVYLEGNGVNDPLFLQIKEEGTPVTLHI